MYRVTDIEPTQRRRTCEEVSTVPAGPEVGTLSNVPNLPERFFVVADSDKMQARCLSFVHRFATHNAETYLLESTAADPAGDVSRLTTALEPDWLCMVALRGSGLMSLFLTGDAEKLLRTAPCPVICIPELFAPAGSDHSLSQDLMPIRRILVPIHPSPHSRRLIEQSVGVAKRFGAKLDLLSVEELVRNPEGSPVASRRSALRMQTRAIRDEMSCLATDVIPKRFCGRNAVSVGLPLFYATIRSSREFNSDLIMLGIPSVLWCARGRIDVGTERILHRALCPVLCIPMPVPSTAVTPNHGSSRTSNRPRRGHGPVAWCRSRKSEPKRPSPARTTENVVESS